MKKFEVFTAEDCRKIAHTLEGLAWGDDGRYMQQAVPLLMTHFNAVLNERGKRVYLDEGFKNFASAYKDPGSTHEALLIGEREIEK